MFLDTYYNVSSGIGETYQECISTDIIQEMYQKIITSGVCIYLMYLRYILIFNAINVFTMPKFVWRMYLEFSSLLERTD